MKRQAGFVLTLELLLITTVLIIGSFAGLASIRDALFKQYVTRQAQEPEIVDANGTRLGKPIDYDEHDAPRIAYIDRSGDTAYRTLIGVRDDRFTSREPLYYEGNSCTGTPCIKTTSDEFTDNVGVDGIAGSGSVSYLHALQGGPNFAVGRAQSGVSGALFREQVNECPVNPEQIGSRWVSQKVVSGEPCEPVQYVAATDANTDCLVDVDNGALCSCPAGFEDQGTILARYSAETDALFNQTYSALSAAVPVLATVNPSIGKVCCPAGSVLDDSADLSQSLVTVAANSIVEPLDLSRTAQRQVDQILGGLSGTLTCRSDVSFQAAVEVPHPGDPSLNALEPFDPPFRVTLPPAASSNAWRPIAPNGETGPDQP